jgi:hypothetical protein
LAFSIEEYDLLIIKLVLPVYTIHNTKNRKNSKIKIVSKNLDLLILSIIN